MINIIAAKAKNNVIGLNDDLPWYIPEDLIRFKKLTGTHSLVMGLNTLLSILYRIGKPLPNRPHFVLTSKKVKEVIDYINAQMAKPELATKFPNFDIQNFQKQVIFCNNFGNAVMRAEAVDPEVFVIGGSRVFADAIKDATRIYLTEIYQDFPGDTFFPKLRDGEWKSVDTSQLFHHGSLPYRYIDLEKITNQALAA